MFKNLLISIEQKDYQIKKIIHKVIKSHFCQTHGRKTLPALPYIRRIIYFMLLLIEQIQ